MPTKQITPTNKRTAKEIEQYWLEHQSRIEKYEAAKQAVQLINAAKNENRNFSTFSKETLRTYLKNPTSYYKNLRNLSRFLYYRSQPYRRLIWYNAGMLDVSARSVVPVNDRAKALQKQKFIKSYYETCGTLEKINLQSEIMKMNIIAWREDCAFGCVYYDDTGLFILPLDPDYCKVTSMYYDGTLSFAMDMSYFDKYTDQLEYFGDPFTGMYNEYQKDKVNNRWQIMPDENCFCLKVNLDDPTLPLPPYLSLFNAIITLCDSEELQAIRDEADIYKLLVLEMETLNGSNEADDFAVDPSTATDYYNRLIQSLPEYVSAALSPMPVHTIEFNKDQTADVNYVENSMEAMFGTSGGGQVLNSTGKATSSAYANMMINDARYSTMTIRPQVQAWINRWLNYHVSNPAKVILLDVNPFNKQEWIKTLKEQATYGMPVVSMLGALDGLSQLELMSLNYLEEDCLEISQKFKPLQSSNTQTTDGEAGAPTKDATDLTDDGDASRDKG